MIKNIYLIKNSYSQKKIFILNKKKKQRKHCIKSLDIFKLYNYRHGLTKKLVSYIKYIHQIKYLFLKKKTNLFLFSHFIYLNGFSYSLLKDYFLKENYSFYKDKWMFEPILLTKLVQTSIYLYKKNNFLLKNNLLITYSKYLSYLEQFNLYKNLLNLTLIPYNIIPLYFFIENNNSIMSISNFYLQLINYNIEDNLIKKNYLINNFFLLPLKSFYLFFFSILSFLYKKLLLLLLQKCHQH